MPPSRDCLIPDGDLIFVVGEAKKQVRVHSAIMKLASPVFAAMLGPNFSEGQRLLAGGEQPTEIKLPEDDPEVFATICKVLHWTMKRDMQVKSVKLLKIVFVADKYDLLGPLEYMVDTSVKALLNSADSKALWRVVLASFVFNSPDNLRAASRKLLYVHEGTIWSLPTATGTMEVGSKLAFALESARATIRERISRLLLMSRIDEVQCQCKPRLLEFFRYSQWLDQNDMLAQDKSLDTLWKMSITIPWDFDVAGLDGKHPCCVQGHKDPGSYGPKLLNDLEALHREIHGLCLECFKRGDYQIFEHKCKKG